MNHRNRRLFAMGAVMFLSVLLDVTVGVYRCLHIAPEATNVLAAALSRSQICLLLVWLALGAEPASWRFWGWLAGYCLTISIFTRLLFPGSPLMLRNEWLAPDWLVFFRPSGPGDLLVKMPVWVVGILAPLALWRLSRFLGRRFKSGLRFSWDRLRATAWRRLQFSFQDAFFWVAAVSVILGAAITTPPTNLQGARGWFHEILHRSIGFYSLENSRQTHAVMAGAVFVMATLSAVWAAQRSRQAAAWMGLPVVITLTAAWWFDVWRESVRGPVIGPAFENLWFDAPSEFAISLVALPMILGALRLVRIYDGPIVADPHPHRSPLPAMLPLEEPRDSSSGLSTAAHHGEHLADHGDRRGTDQHHEDAGEDEQH